MYNRLANRLRGLLCRWGLPAILCIVTAYGCLSPAAMAAGDPGIGAVLSDRLYKRLADRPLRPDAGRTTMSVILHTNKPGLAHTVVHARGGKVRYRYRDMTEIEVPPGRLAQLLSALPAGTMARLPYPHTTNSTIGQGVAVTGAGDMQSLGNNGVGIMVGVIDLGFSSYTNAQAYGDLPNPLTIVDYTGSGTGGITHGTNVAEIVYDMAPGVDLYLAKINTTTQMATAVSDMIAAGVSVIVHSVGWFGAAYYDGSGTLCDIVNDAENGGIVWANSMGNSRNKHYDAIFSDTNGNLRHEFSAGQDYNTITLNANQSASLVLNWDAYPSTSIDYDLYLYDGDPAAGGSVVASSTNRQSANGRFKFPQPYESINFTAPGGIPASTAYYITVQKVNGSQTDVPLTLHSLDRDLSVRVRARSLSQPADCANALGVAATRVDNDAPEGFSAEGPNKAGLNKPDIAAPDRVQTSLSGSFAGTSASAPHVAGAVALLQADNPGISTVAVRNLLMGTSQDVHTAGFDFRTGPGRVSLDADVDDLNHDTDNCPLLFNPDQTDTDNDLLGDSCDDDDDNDGLSDIDEAIHGTDSLDPDSDLDGLSDGDEVNIHGTDPLDNDSDNDNLLDGEEINTYGTLPNDSDTDGDGANDGVEVSAGTDPLNDTSFPADGDINEDGLVNAADVLLATRIVTGDLIPTASQLLHGDVAPLIGGVPALDGVMTAGDLLLIQRKALGMVSF